MGVAIGFALTQPPVHALAVFEALGLGLALPFLALTLVPAWRRFLPKPGRWMERLRQVLALPLYASVAWLVWVVSQQAGTEGAALVAGGPGAHRGRGLAPSRHAPGVPAMAARRRRLALGCVAAAVAIGPLAASSASSAAAAAPRGARWEPFTPERLAELRAQGGPVFVNATAAWCITCLVNERVALPSPGVAEAFAKRGRRVPQGRLDQQEPQDHRAARVVRAERRAPLRRLRQDAGTSREVLPQILSERDPHRGRGEPLSARLSNAITAKEEIIRCERP